MAALSGCTTASLDAAAPQQQTSSASGPKDTGRYPNLNIVPKGANAQLTTQDKMRSVAELQAARKQQKKAAAGGGVSNPADLVRMARAQREQTLKKIETEE